MCTTINSPRYKERILLQHSKSTVDFEKPPNVSQVECSPRCIVCRSDDLTFLENYRCSYYLTSISSSESSRRYRCCCWSLLGKQKQSKVAKQRDMKTKHVGRTNHAILQPSINFGSLSQKCRSLSSQPLESSVSAM